ncbi:MAG: HD domain-containing protein [Nitrospiraceae bacterium]|nr:HD domain-containing protein [Nitrospiraceae bacterium]
MLEKLGLQRLFFNISSLVDLSQEVTSSKGFDDKMKSSLYVVTGMFSVPEAALLVYNANKSDLELHSSKGLKEAKNVFLKIKLGQIKKFAKNEAVNLNGYSGNGFYKENENNFKKLKTKIFIPLFAKGEFVGALSLGKRLSRTTFLKSEKTALKVVVNQMAIALYNLSLFKKLTVKVQENEKMYENMRLIYHDTIQAFAAAIDAKDPYTRNHSYRVATYSVAVAKELRWKERDVEGIYIAGLLHDIGKIVIDKKVINKDHNLTEFEIEEIKKHPGFSFDILSKIKLPWEDVIYFVKHHHERIDGNGYPDHLNGAGLNDGMKILALADAFDAMTTDRPYRKKLTLLETLEEVKNCLGTQFDRKISKVFFKVLQKELNGHAKEAQIIPHLDKNFDPKVITALLESLIEQLRMPLPEKL